jgi:hypothetical protein
MINKKLGLCFVILFAIFSLQGCIEDLELASNPPENDQGVVTDPPVVEEPPVQDPSDVTPDDSGVIITEVPVDDRIRDFLENGPVIHPQFNGPTSTGGTPTITRTIPGPVLSGANLDRIVSQLPTAPQAPTPVEPVACEFGGEEGVKLYISEDAMVRLAGQYCESFAAVVVSEESSEECHELIGDCVEQTSQQLYNWFEDYSHTRFCAHDFGGSLTHPVEDRFCCEKATYNMVILNTYGMLTFRPKRNAIGATCS